MNFKKVMPTSSPWGWMLAAGVIAIAASPTVRKKVRQLAVKGTAAVLDIADLIRNQVNRTNKSSQKEAFEFDFSKWEVAPPTNKWEVTPPINKEVTPPINKDESKSNGNREASSFYAAQELGIKIDPEKMDRKEKQTEHEKTQLEMNENQEKQGEQ
jgi:hypothetical protein